MKLNSLLLGGDWGFLFAECCLFKVHGRLTLCPVGVQYSCAAAVVQTLVLLLNNTGSYEYFTCTHTCTTTAVFSTVAGDCDCSHVMSSIQSCGEGRRSAPLSVGTGIICIPVVLVPGTVQTRTSGWAFIFPKMSQGHITFIGFTDLLKTFNAKFQCLLVFAVPCIYLPTKFFFSGRSAMVGARITRSTDD